MHTADDKQSWLLVPALIGGAVGGVLLGLLLNITASWIDPSYAPFIVRWGWFGLVIYFSAYVICVSPIRRSIAASWCGAKSKLIFVGVYGAISVGYIWGARTAIDAAWKALSPKTSIAHDEKKDTELRSALASIAKNNQPGTDGLFISEKNAVKMLRLLWSVGPHSVSIFHGCSFETISFFDQVKAVLTSGDWTIAVEVSVCPPDQKSAMTVNAKTADTGIVLLLQSVFDVAGVDLKYAGESGLVSGVATLHLP